MEWMGRGPIEGIDPPTHQPTINSINQSINECINQLTNDVHTYLVLHRRPEVGGQAAAGVAVLGQQLPMVLLQVRHLQILKRRLAVWGWNCEFW